MDTKLERHLLDLIFSSNLDRRFTQDTPILPDVWLAYANDNDGENYQDILIQPWFDQQPGDLIVAWKNRLGEERWSEFQEKARIASNQSNVVARLDFQGLLGLVLPETRFWTDMIRRESPDVSPIQFINKLRENYAGFSETPPLGDAAIHFCVLVGIVADLGTGGEDQVKRAENFFNELSRLRRQPPKEMSTAIAKGMLPIFDFLEIGISKLKGAFEIYQSFDRRPSAAPLIWSVNRNRPATLSLHASRRTVKADAVERVFDHDASRITWAIIDSGIDARHPAFVDWRNGFQYRDGDNENKGINPSHSRIIATYDFVRLREILFSRKLPNNITGDQTALKQVFGELKHRVSSGRAIDWDLIKPFIEIKHDQNYLPPQNAHGTHVAGILGADWGRWIWHLGLDPNEILGSPYLPDHEMRGICPGIRLIDIRVFDNKGEGDEFSCNAALQFIAHLNRNRDMKVVHGVNLSMSLEHNVSNFACGQTPICLECQNLIGDGVVVVAAAGNAGYQTYQTDHGMLDAYHSISITDPGNADCVITVGATHRERPHTYGVSYFSSRGPTGDGRAKPDLVAPGEKIFAPIPDCGAKFMDGTSMAAPHVSGAAAILMSRHQELIGRPDRIKEILCNTATDLGRERYFQGAGLLDILRALESI